MRPVGIVDNPVSGKDVRRLLTNAGTSTLGDKVGVVRRLLVGASEAGTRRFLVLPEPQGIVRRALATSPFASQLEVADAVTARHHDERDTIAAARALRAAGCAAVAVLGGDGTNRAVALGWPDVPVLPISTGTNNAFPLALEPTMAGAAAGHLACGRADVAQVAAPSKVVRVGLDGDGDDLALVDGVLLRAPASELGSLKPFDPATLDTAVLALAVAAAVGVSSLGAVLAPVGAADDHGLVVRCVPAGSEGARTVRAPLAPGTYADVGVGGWDRLTLGERVTVAGPGLLALDGDRRRTLAEGQQAELRVERSGARVVDLVALLALDEVRHHWLRP